jgi:hypothetical protein
MKVTLPGQTTTVDAGDGVDPIWFEKLQAMVKIVNAFDAISPRLAILADVFSEIYPDTLIDGQVLIWNATSKKFEPGAN